MRENKGYEDRGRMSSTIQFQGSLFANEFLRDAVTRLDDWRDIGDGTLATFEASVRDVFDGFPIAGSPNESQTEDDLIWPVLLQLGWTASLRQQNLSAHGRGDVPDGLLFRDAPMASLRNGNVMSSALRSSSPSAGSDRSTAAPGVGARKMPPRPRCCAIFGAWMT